MDKVESTSLNLTKLNIEKLKEFFPNVVNEGKIDFEMLRVILGDEVDDKKEKYQFIWPGKTDAIKMAQLPSSATLRPDKASSKDWNKTENLYIEGDNLEVLKQLQKTYYGKIKLIYIDPPYNTGHDFIYKDDFKNSIINYKEQTNQGLSSNPEINGRYHTDWLNMIYPRLQLAKNLLTDDGIICMSIDDSEYDNLKKISDEIFGTSNYINTVCIKMSEASGIKMAHVDKKLPKMKEYLLVYGKQNVKIENIRIPKEKWDNEYKTLITNLTKEELRYIKDVAKKDDRTDFEFKTCMDLLEKANYISVVKAYQEENIISKEEQLKWNYENAYRIFQTVSMSGGTTDAINIKRKEDCKNIFFPYISSQNKMYIIKGNYDLDMKKPRIQVLFADEYLTINPGDFWQDIKTTGLDNEGGVPFKNGKKPLKYIQRVLEMVDTKDAIVLDFFSGSATTAEAVFKMNYIDKSNRKFIMVQLPEKIDEKSDAHKLGFSNICEIGKERIRLAGDQLKTEYIKAYKGDNLFADEKEIPYDIGFKVFKLDSTNIKPWDNEIEMDELTLFNQEEVFKSDRTKNDVLYEIMLKYGVFDMQATEINVNGKTMYRVGKRYMIVCLEDDITIDDVHAIADLRPRTVVFKESGFVDDNAKINAVYNLAKAGVEDVKCI